MPATGERWRTFAAQFQWARVIRSSRALETLSAANTVGPRCPPPPPGCAGPPYGAVAGDGRVLAEGDDERGDAGAEPLVEILGLGARLLDRVISSHGRARARPHRPAASPPRWGAARTARRPRPVRRAARRRRQARPKCVRERTRSHKWDICDPQRAHLRTGRKLQSKRSCLSLCTTPRVKGPVILPRRPRRAG